MRTPASGSMASLLLSPGAAPTKNQHRRQIASAAKAALTKQEKSSEKDVDALTFMQTVVMSFVRGMVWRTNAAHQ